MYIHISRRSMNIGEKTCDAPAATISTFDAFAALV